MKGMRWFMQTTTALRLYGKRDLRLETFTLPAMQDDEILARVVTGQPVFPHGKRPIKVPIIKRCQMMWPPGPYYRS